MTGQSNVGDCVLVIERYLGHFSESVAVWHALRSLMFFGNTGHMSEGT